MKEIVAIIRLAKMNETKEALAALGLPSFLSTGKVQGRGKGMRASASKYQEYMQDATVAEDYTDFDPFALHTKRFVVIFVRDEMVDAAVEAIIKVNKTGNPGDGKIFICPAADVYQIRTGETGEKVLD